jgi:hypothetical protein
VSFEEDCEELDGSRASSCIPTDCSGGIVFYLDFIPNSSGYDDVVFVEQKAYNNPIKR